MLYTAKSLTRSFGSTKDSVCAVDRLSLEIRENSFTAVTGPSGSGKSTLVSLLAALDRATSGTLRFGEIELQQCSEQALARCRRRIGFVFQQLSLAPRMTVADNVGCPLIPRGVFRRQRHEIARARLASVGLEDKLWRKPSQLSGGEQQRVAIARALVGEPDVLIGDEPTSDLDAGNTLAIIDQFNSHRRNGGTVIVATHDPRLIEVADQILQLDRGRLVSVG